mmetsp:Transcript_4349/g.6092  ORF Transcript_4349/g.6092 Transcript_4349/m.6092 type:complete len:208 (+) Transcript_4349:444-1067(+)
MLLQRQIITMIITYNVEIVVPSTIVRYTLPLPPIAIGNADSRSSPYSIGHDTRNAYAWESSIRSSMMEWIIIAMRPSPTATPNRIRPCANTRDRWTSFRWMHPSVSDPSLPDTLVIECIGENIMPCKSMHTFPSFKIGIRTSCINCNRPETKWRFSPPTLPISKIPLIPIPTRVFVTHGPSCATPIMRVVCRESIYDTYPNRREFPI